MTADEKPRPVQVRFLGPEAILQIPNALADLVEQACGAKSGCAGFHARFILVKNTVSSTQVAYAKQLSGGFSAKNIPHRPAYPAVPAG